MTDVKQTGKRARRAQETRRRMVDAAHALFVEQGYGATLLPEVAARAGVAVQTIYFTFGNKRSLLKEVVDVAIAGDLEPVATMDRAWFRAVVEADTVETGLRALVAGTKEVLVRAAPITKVLEAAVAADPEVGEIWPRSENPRLTVQTAAAKALVSMSGLAAGLTLRQTTDALYGLLSPELFLVMVQERRWSPERWERWVFALLRSQLCAPAAAGHRVGSVA